jgi:hypothetical protein
MHGYPIYAPWAEGATDDQLVPFLARVTAWLGNGRDVLFSEFGLPTHRHGDSSKKRGRGDSTPLVDENAAAVYTASTLEGLRRAGCSGAMLWCYSDYPPTLWDSPPFDLAPHERTFGLWRDDGSPKPAVAAVTAFVGAERCAVGQADAWIDIDRGEFQRDPKTHMPRLYRRYRGSRRAT